MDAYDWSPPAPGRIVSGPSALDSLPGLLSELDLTRVVLVTSPSMSRSPVFATARERAGDHVVHATVTPHSPMMDVRKLRDLAVATGADGYVAVGGSSVIDTVKAAVWLDLGTTRRRSVAIPAMFGGAEVTPRAGVTDEGHKVGLSDERIVPDVVVLDPRVPAALPSRLAHVSVANALAHCVEGLAGTGRSPLTDAFYLRSLALIRDGVDRLDDPHEALSAFQNASVLAALPRVRMAAAHAIVHVLAPVLGVAHAVAHGVLCRTVMSYTAPAVPDRHALIADALHAPAALDGVTALLDRLGVPRGLRSAGAGREQLPLVADALVESGLPGNPRSIGGRDELMRILDHAWSGELPRTW
ncbi:1,3-propanediol dehydrogenase [Amycolatopsis deserti]|uniref:1,3-propanediol dehydrogenase n=1 Tax=Amycolatopsis deserti TaxID=185696 RepID=A0ABQ3IG67_9PSEU|nr:iron-containing alcohol dehydrogenase [Amycolatopsis deserti]GHE79941.1 1,3-propanediol dehydrogenase [Amycolatopsis deserti]